MTMMLRIPLFLLALFTYQASALDPNAVCNPCGIDGYNPTKNANFADGAGGTLSCSTIQGWANDRLNKHDVCQTIVGYTRAYCGCQNSSGQPAPPLPAVDNTVDCPVCSYNPDKWEVNPGYENGVLISGKKMGMRCMDMAMGSQEQAYTSLWCVQIQDIMSKYCCGARRRNLRGDEEFQEELDEAKRKALESKPENQEAWKERLAMKGE
jgi:hypothetical protein